MLIVIKKEELPAVSGSSDLLSPESGIMAIGSVSMFAQSAALALKKHAPQLSAKEIVGVGLKVATETCIYMNDDLASWSSRAFQ